MAHRPTDQRPPSAEPPVSPKANQGFTLIELLVVIAIIGVLVGLLLPAVQQARESARRASCVNNFKQLGLAIHNFNDANQRLPTAGDWVRGRNVTGSAWGGGNHDLGSGFVKLLPFLEQNTLYGQLKFDNAGTSVHNQLIDGKRLRFYAIGTFVCPSDGHGGNVPSSGFMTNNQNRGVSNYAFSVGPTGKSGNGNPACSCSVNYNSFRPTTTGQPWPFGAWNGWNFTQGGRRPNPAGCFIREDPDHFVCKFKDVPDGLSKTIFMGEVRMECSQATRQGWAVSGPQGIHTTLVPLNYDSCAYAAGGTGAAAAAASLAAAGGDGCAASWSWQTEQGFKSQHPGVVNFLMGDGSVMSVSENCDHYTLQRFGCRADGLPEGTL